MRVTRSSSEDSSYIPSFNRTQSRKSASNSRSSVGISDDAHLSSRRFDDLENRYQQTSHVWIDKQFLRCGDERIDLMVHANTDDASLLDLVICHCQVKVVGIDPKNGQFDLRMKVSWKVRTRNLGEETEPRSRVPGIRMPSLSTCVEESRIWREYLHDTEHSFGWCGVSVFMIMGWEVFEVQEFPFDRQVVDLEVFEFVWRRDKDETTYEESMKVAELVVETHSMLPEWGAYPALVAKERDGKSSRFRVRLRLQRRKRFYVIQVFFLTTLITESSMFPLALVSGKDGPIGDRLALYAGGLLTLVAFKYSIAEQLPTVPYSTFLGKVLTAQMATLMFLSAEAVLAYKFGRFTSESSVDHFEDALLIALCVGWLAFLIYVAFLKRRTPWKNALEGQEHLVEGEDRESVNNNNRKSGMPKSLTRSLSQTISRSFTRTLGIGSRWEAESS